MTARSSTNPARPPLLCDENGVVVAALGTFDAVMVKCLLRIKATTVRSARRLRWRRPRSDTVRTPVKRAFKTPGAVRLIESIASPEC